MALIQDRFKGYPWKVLMASILLVRTGGKQVTNIVTDFSTEYPAPESLWNADGKSLKGFSHYENGERKIL